jgi:hypothetical protein
MGKGTVKGMAQDTIKVTTKGTARP